MVTGAPKPILTLLVDNALRKIFKDVMEMGHKLSNG